MLAYTSPEEDNPLNTPDDILEVAKKRLEEKYIAIGLVDRFQESLENFRYYLGWKNIPQDKRWRVSRKIITKKNLDNAMIEKIKQLNHLDIKLYEYAQTLFEKQLANHTK